MTRKTVAMKKKSPVKKLPIRGGRSVKDYFPTKPRNPTINDAVDQSTSAKGVTPEQRPRRISPRIQEAVTKEMTSNLPSTDTNDNPPCTSSTAVAAADQISNPQPSKNKRKAPDSSSNVAAKQMRSGKTAAGADPIHPCQPTKNKRKAPDSSYVPAKTRVRSDLYKPLLTRMSPSLITSLFKMDPSEQQIEAIKSMGFGGLLQLQSESINGHLARWIVENFNPFDCSLMDHKLVISDEDVHVATGLPMGGIDVVPAGMFSKDKEYTEAVKHYRDQFPTADITKKELLEKMMGQRDGGDDFKRNFLIYIVNVLLMGVVGDHPSPRILGCISNLADVPSMNWCKFARSNMIDNVMSWKAASATSPKAYFKGPILIFQMIYLDRVVFMTRTVARSFPLWANWTDEKIRERVKLEKHKGGGFGKGSVEPSFVYAGPRLEAQHEPQPQPENEPQDEPQPQAETEVEAELLDEKKESIKYLAETAIRLADAYGEFTKAVKKAECKVSGFPVVAQMSNLAESLFEGFSLSQQSREEGEREGDKVGTDAAGSGDQVVDDDNDNEIKKRKEVGEVGEELEKDKGEEEELKKDEGAVEELLNKDEGEFNGRSVDDEFLADPSVMAELEGLLNDAYDHVGKVFESHHEDLKEKKAKEKALLEGPSFSLFSGDDAFYTSQEFLESRMQDMHLTVPHASTSTTPPVLHASTSDPISPILISSQLSPQQPSPVVISSQDALDSPVEEPPTAPTEYTMETRQMAAKTVQAKRVQPKRSVEVADVYRSPFFIRNVDMVRGLTQLEKLVGDYAFSNELVEEEVLYCHAGKTLTRSRMKSLLLGGQVHPDVISIWCDHLNELNKYRNRKSPCRLFLTDTTDIAALDLNFEDVKLVLIPIVTPLPLLFCYYVDKNMLDVMHLMPESTDYHRQVKPVVNLLLTLESRIPILASAWLLTPTLYLPHCDIEVECDTGIYLMRHMEMYNGVKARFGSKVGMKEKVDVKRYIVKVCNEIITCQHNSLSDDVIAAAKAYNHGSQICNPVPQLESTDLQLINYIRENAGDKHEVVVDTDWLQVTKGGLHTLLPGNWLMDMVIDVVGVRTTLANPSVVYFPTIISAIVRKNGFRSQYIRLSYLPRDLSTAKWAFFPYCVDKEHWFACVTDFEKRMNFILDSNLPRRPDVRRKFLVEQLLPAVDIITRDFPSYSRLLEMKDFKWEFVNVPRQDNGYACGGYMLKWLENLSNQASWTDKRFYEDLDEYCTSMIARLIKWDLNKRKVYH